MTIWFAHCFVPSPGYGLVCPVLSSRARACRRDHQAPSAPLPDVGVAFVRETYPASCGDITPRSSLVRVHAPVNFPDVIGLPLGRLGRLPALVHDATSRGSDFEAADIPLCSSHQVCSPPRLLPPLRLCRRAAEAFTSGQNVLRCLRTHRIS